MPDFESFRGVRIAAHPDALDGISWPAGVRVMRVAPDEVIALDIDESDMAKIQLDDRFAIRVAEHGYCGVRLPRSEFDSWFHSAADWDLPTVSPSFAQGSVAGIPVKLLIYDHEVLVVTRVSLRHELEARL